MRFKKLFWSALTLSILFLIATFAGIFKLIINSNWHAALDNRVLNAIESMRDAGWTKFYSVVTELGDWKLLAIATIIIIFIFWRYNKRGYIVPWLVTIIGSELFTAIGKVIVARPRPLDGLIPENGFSFPSGHATIAVAFYGFLAYILISTLKSRSWKIFLFIVAILIIALTGFSRLYLGVHYFSDVMAGYFVGAIWLAIGISISKKESSQEVK